MATRLKDTAKETGQEALDRGKVVAQSAMETAREEGSEQGRELAAELKERVQPGQRRRAGGVVASRDGVWGSRAVPLRRSARFRGRFVSGNDLE